MQDTPPMTALEIKMARAALGLSQRAFADALCGTSRRTIEDWEGNRSAPPPFLRLAIAALNNGIKPWHLSITDTVLAIINNQPGRYEVSEKECGSRRAYDMIVAEIRASLAEMQIYNRVSFSEGNTPEMSFVVEIY